MVVKVIRWNWLCRQWCGSDCQLCFEQPTEPPDADASAPEVVEVR